MANGNRRLPHDISATTLGVRIDNLAEDVYGLAAKYDAAKSPNWQMLGVAVSVLVVIGGMAYLPISTATSDLKAATLRLEELTRETKVSVARLEEQNKNLSARYDAISNRLAELIRTGK